MTHRQILVVLSGLLAGLFLVAVSQTIVATALPVIAGELGRVDMVAWIVTSYLLATTTATPLFGRMSDVYGRRRMFQIAIAIFLVGSAASGFATDMTMLIVARAVQGAGGGGVMALVMTIVGDLLSPRERGRYQGYIGGVFGLASLSGPLLGGFFVEYWSWRWAFFITIPIGLIALAITNKVLRLPHRPNERSIDYLGAVLLVVGVSCLLLVASLGGTTYSWDSALIVSLAASGALLTVVFILRQAMTPEPLIPLRLFASRTFSLAAGAGFIVGAAMFGALVFLPVFLQLVTGSAATEAGLLMTPLMIGIVCSSTISGRLIARTGRYKAHPVIGAVLLAVSFALLATMSATTSRVTAAIFMGMLGVSLGLLMQNLVMIVQNDVPATDLGAATGTINFTRSLGGAVGTALFGTIMSAVLARRLTGALPDGADVDPAAIHGRPDSVLALEPALRNVVIDAFSSAISWVFLLAIPLALVALILIVALPARPLRETRHVSANLPADPSISTQLSTTSEPRHADPYDEAPPGATTNRRDANDGDTAD